MNASLEARQVPALRIRIGINTGEVVTGDDAATLATGDAVNTAKRLEEAAGGGEILIGAVTERLVRHASRLVPLDAVEAKGKSAPVEAWRVLEAITGAESFARRWDTPLVGRTRELALLRDELTASADAARVPARDGDRRGRCRQDAARVRAHRRGRRACDRRRRALPPLRRRDHLLAADGAPAAARRRAGGGGRDGRRGRRRARGRAPRRARRERIHAGGGALLGRAAPVRDARPDAAAARAPGGRPLGRADAARSRRARQPLEPRRTDPAPLRRAGGAARGAAAVGRRARAARAALGRRRDAAPRRARRPAACCRRSSARASRRWRRGIRSTPSSSSPCSPTRRGRRRSSSSSRRRSRRSSPPGWTASIPFDREVLERAAVVGKEFWPGAVAALGDGDETPRADAARARARASSSSRPSRASPARTASASGTR